MLTNLCLLEEKGFDKSYEGLIKSGTISKALIGFSEFLNSSDQCTELKGKEFVHKYYAESFEFLKKCLTPNTDAENFVKVYASLSHLIENS